MGLISNIFRMGKDEDYEAGMTLYNQHRYREALEKFTAVLGSKSHSTSLHRNLAQCYAGYAHRNLGIMRFALGDFAAALVEFESALKFCKNPETIQLFMGICQNNLGNYEEAVQTFTTMLDSDPSSLPTKLKLGVALHNLQMWNKAVDVYRNILDQRPGYADVHYRLGLALLCKGEATAAAAAFERAVAINPDYVDAQIKLGLTQAYLGRYDEALALFVKLLGRFPAYADMHYYTGIIHANRGRPEEAATCFREALRINPTFKDARVKLAILEFHRGDHRAALGHLEDAARLNPADVELGMALDVLAGVTSAAEGPGCAAEEFKRIFGSDSLLADTIQKLGRNLKINPELSVVLAIVTDLSTENTALYDMLIPVVREYITEHPEYPDLHNTIGGLYQRLGNARAAEAAFREAVRLNANYLGARINLFKNLIFQHKYEEALEHGRQILNANVLYPDIFLGMGSALMELGRDEEALPYLKRALETRPRYATAYFLLGKLLARKGRTAEAVLAYDSCLKAGPTPEQAEEAQRQVAELQR